MATPHVTGLAAYLLEINGTPMSPSDLRFSIQGFATTGALSFGDAVAQDGTPNLLAFNGASA
jgi:hypothetical protein